MCGALSPTGRLSEEAGSPGGTPVIRQADSDILGFGKHLTAGLVRLLQVIRTRNIQPLNSFLQMIQLFCSIERQ